MIQQRNRIACYVRDRDGLPPMLQDSRLCGKCYAKTPCFIYHKLIDDGNGTTSGLREEFMRHVKHLKPAHKDFFIKWNDLLSKEEDDAYRFRKELWTMASAEREKVGRCFGGLVIDTSLSDEVTTAPKINRYKYTLIKGKATPNFSFTESQITIGEPIVISDEQGHYALANGYVSSVRSNRITVLVDRKLQDIRTRSKDFDAINNQSFAGIMQVSKDTASQESGEPMLYRLDKDEFSNGMATVRNNIIRLMDPDAFGSHSLRQLLIELKAPSFENLKSSGDPTFGSQAILNIDQQNAVSKVMAAKDYALVLGMPGTGKTTTIAHIIRALVAKGKSVLLTSYTHTAVDNILLKIKNDKISILRLGATSKIHPEVQSFADLASEPKKSFEGIQQSYSAQVVATTCLGVNHAIFNARIFDYCIVDEASQITLPVCLGPIAMAKRFVLVGDHNQLPPLVQNKEALEGGLDVSLFKLLSDSHPGSVVNLEHQYRMCSDIMLLSNSLVYSGHLKCGTPSVANSTLHIPNPSALKIHHHTLDTIPANQLSFCPGPNPGSCWLRDTLDPSQKVIFLNTDRIGSSAQEISNGPRITNPFEVSITTQTVLALLSVGIPAAEIGVITLYRSQLALLKHSLLQHQHQHEHQHQRNHSTSPHNNQQNQKSTPPPHQSIEMHTADKFQGRDKEIILLSLVRSNTSNTIGDLLQDWRRVNVALTRARTKLIIIGSFGTICRETTPLLERFGGICQERGWVYDLREGAREGHYFEDVSGTQMQTPSGCEGKKKKIARGVEEEGTGEGGGESDFEIGSSGQSPTKKSSTHSPTKNNNNKNTLQKKRIPPDSGVNKPFKRVSFTTQRGRTDVRRLLGSRGGRGGRSVLRDVVNDVIGSGSGS